MKRKYLGAGIIHFIPNSKPYDDTEFKQFKERLAEAHEEFRAASNRPNEDSSSKT